MSDQQELNAQKLIDEFNGTTPVNPPGAPKLDEPIAVESPHSGLFAACRKDVLPQDKDLFTYDEYAKRGVTQISRERLSPGSVVRTLEGPYVTSEISRLAIDSSGNIYPIAESVFYKSYTKTTASQGTSLGAYVGTHTGETPAPEGGVTLRYDARNEALFDGPLPVIEATDCANGWHKIEVMKLNDTIAKLQKRVKDLEAARDVVRKVLDMV